MRGVWNVAKHTFAYALRMKIAGIFILMLAIALAVLPFVMKGDGTLAGRLRTFLVYSTAATSVLLSLVTIFVSTAIITGDVRGKQIFTVLTKPVGRWQYTIGRWLGVTMLNVMLLAIASIIIFAMAQHLRSTKAMSPTDRRTVETEVFTARVEVPADSFEERIRRRVQSRIEELQSNNQFESALDSYRQQLKDEQRAREALLKELQKQEIQALESVKPGGTLSWSFSDVQVTGEQVQTQGTVRAVDKEMRMVRIEAPSDLIGQLVYRGPVRIEDVDAGVVNLQADYFDVLFTTEDIQRAAVSALESEDEVRIEVDPTIQLSYKAKASGSVPGDTLRSTWQVLNPETGYLHVEPPRSHAKDLPVTLTVSGRAVTKEGKTRATYLNMNPVSVSIPREDIHVLYKQGGFALNFVRGQILILCQLAFLGALGVFAGSFLSFPVACLLCFGALPFSMMRDFLAESTHAGAAGLGATDVFTVLGYYILRIMSLLLPNFSRTNPSDALVEGMYISWEFVGSTVGVVFVLQTLVMLAIACVIFRKRELARVQV